MPPRNTPLATRHNEVHNTTMKKRWKVLFLAGALLGLSIPGVMAVDAGLTIGLVDGQRLTLHARNADLRDVLMPLTRAGVTVRLDTNINARITADFELVDVDTVLKKLLGSLDYILVWESIPGPVGSLQRLVEIQVFPKGNPRQLQTLRPSAPQIATAKPYHRISRFVKDELLIRLHPGTSTEAFRQLLQSIGGTVVESYPVRGIYRIHLPDNTDLFALLEKLKGNAIIATAEPNFVYPLPGAIAGIKSKPGESLSGKKLKTAANAAPIAILDSGLAANSGLDGVVLAGIDALDPTRPLTDNQGHGTQMALISSGAISPDGITASSDAMPVIPIRTFNDQGMTTSLNLTRSIDFAVQNGAKVISMSWGSEDDSFFLQEALNQAAANDVILVAAAGNEPTGQPSYPAAFPNVIGVAATDPNGQPWPSSNYGTFVDLTAPSYASLPVGYEGPPGEYAGTSISAAFVANTIARYRTEHPEATSSQVIYAVQGSLSPPASTNPAMPMGTGTLDQSAVQKLLN